MQFTEATGRAGIHFQHFHGARSTQLPEDMGSGAAWGDYDGDGLPDLYVVDVAGPLTDTPEQLAHSPGGNRLYHNNGDGTFTEVAKEAGVDDATGRSLSAAWYDFDGDGWPDLYVANDLWGSKLFLNLHNGRFRDVTREAGVSDYRGAMGIAIGDWDNDGAPDIFITHWIRQEHTLFGNFRFKLRRSGDADSLYFGDITNMVGLGGVSLNYIGWGTSFFDYDNDGRLDLFVVNGSTFPEDNDPRHLVPMKNFLFWQKDPGEGFVEVGAASGAPFQKAHVGRGAAFADYDNDGNVDVFIVNQEGRPVLLRNKGGSRNNWIKVRVKCAKSNRTGFGTKVQIEAGGRSQAQEIASQTSYLSQSFQEAHFGLSREKEVTRLTVTFPSGIVRVKEHVPANQVVTVAE